MSLRNQQQLITLSQGRSNTNNIIIITIITIIITNYIIASVNLKCPLSLSFPSSLRFAFNSQICLINRNTSK